MRKKLALSILFLSFFISVGTINVVADSGSYDSTSLLRISIWPKKLSWPKSSMITGVSLGLPSSYGVPLVTGADLSLMWGNSLNVKGFKAAPVCTGAKLDGIQAAVYNRTDDFSGGELGLINIAEDLTGIQLGVYNKTEAGKGGAQLGIVNFARSSNGGVQFGIVNIMKNGFLPVFPIFNFPAR